MRTAIRRTALVALALFGAPVSGSEPIEASPAPSPRRAVVARLGEPGLDFSGPPHSIRRIRLGDATRPGLQLEPGEVFEVRAAAAGRRLIFSIGTEGRGSGLRFVLDQATAEGWREIFEEVLPSSQPGWVDREIELPAADGPERPRLRFRSESSGLKAAGEGRAAWGGVCLVADEKPELPNILLVSLDTLGASYLGAYGGDEDVSPAIDGFLAEAFDFRRAYAQYGITNLSHKALFSGLYPIRRQGGATTDEASSRCFGSLPGAGGSPSRSRRTPSWAPPSASTASSTASTMAMPAGRRLSRTAPP